jgi:hypothetical protein
MSFKPNYDERMKFAELLKAKKGESYALGYLMSAFACENAPLSDHYQLAIDGLESLPDFK